MSGVFERCFGERGIGSTLGGGLTGGALIGSRAEEAIGLAGDEEDESS